MQCIKSILPNVTFENQNQYEIDSSTQIPMLHNNCKGYIVLFLVFTASLNERMISFTPPMSVLAI